MQDLSGFATLIARSLLMRIELEAALDVVAKPRPQRYHLLPLIGHGAPFAFGKRGLRVRSGDQDCSDSPHAAGVIATATHELTRAILRGPADDAEVARLKGYGWDPMAGRRIAEQRAKQEREQVTRFDDPPLIAAIELALDRHL
jgi:hypothetical protein